MVRYHIYRRAVEPVNSTEDVVEHVKVAKEKEALVMEEPVKDKVKLKVKIV